VSWHAGEQLIGNYSTMMAVAVLMGVHPLVWLIWLGYRLIISYENHSGYAVMQCGRGSRFMESFRHSR
jgi:hypothetical protein